jgi:hypothetical protein
MIALGWSTDGESATIPFQERYVTLEGGAKYGAAHEVFWIQTYGWLDVLGKWVVDVGASVGDSAVFFHLKGARGVIAFESDSELAELCRRNLLRNGAKEFVVLAQACETLDDLPAPVGPDPVLKMDCEGAEFPILERTSDRGLRQFSQILMEYHRSPGPLLDRLRTAGFSYRLDGPGRKSGMLRAVRKDPVLNS